MIQTNTVNQYFAAKGLEAELQGRPFKRARSKTEKINEGRRCCVRTVPQKPKMRNKNKT